MNHFTEEEIIVQKYTSPILVPSIDESDESMFQMWQKLDGMSDAVRSILSHDDTMHSIHSIAKSMQLNLTQSAFLARAVRLYYFGELSLEKFSEYFVENIGVDSRSAQRMADVLARKIIKKPIKESKERISIRVALDRMPEIKDQKITDGGLVVAGSHVRMAGTIENWITDYHLAIGQGKHTAMERGNYLFHNSNTKALSAQERQRVAMVLKSFDENIALIVDTVRTEVIFPALPNVPEREGVTRHNTIRNTPQKTAAQLKIAQSQHVQQPHAARTGVNNGTIKSKRNPSGFVRFTSGQKMATEKESGRSRV